MPQNSRPLFVENLHNLLEHSLDESSLRWISKDKFEITSNEVKARRALSPTWSFQSLGSFIRQLSYYGFKRLSDRRKPTEREATHILFTHPSKFFLRGDSSHLHLVLRRPRVRPAQIRRPSNAASTATPATASCSYDGDVSSPRPFCQSSPPPRSPTTSSPLRWVANEGKGWRQYNPNSDGYQQTAKGLCLTIDIYPYHGDPTTSYVTSPYSPTNSYSTSDYMEATSSIHKSLPSPTGTVFPARSAPHSSPSYPCSEAQSSMMTAFLLTPQTTYFSKFWGNLHAEPADNEGVHTFM